MSRKMDIRLIKKWTMNEQLKSSGEHILEKEFKVQSMCVNRAEFKAITYIHMAAVIWRKHCRYGVKHYPINIHIILRKMPNISTYV